MNKSVLRLTYGGVMAALTLLATAIISLPVAVTNGYIHLGDGLVLSCGVVLGKKYGALAAGIGSALADVFLGYAAWALPTFLIKALMAFIIGYAFEQFTEHRTPISANLAFIARWTVALIAAGTVLIVLYYLTSGLMYGNWIAPISAIPKDLIQFAFGVAIVTVLLPITTRFRGQLNTVEAHI